MIEEEHDFCPFIKENCRKDCTFFATDYYCIRRWN